MDPYFMSGNGDESDDEYLDYSDEEDIICSSKYVISSDEDDDAFFATISKSAKMRSKPRVTKYEDDFEKEMASELSATMNSLASSFSKPKQVENKPGPSQNEAGGSKGKEDTEEDSEFYDDVYFDSDDSEGEDAPAAESNARRPKNKKEKRRILSNDELFYDPNMDDRDQQWMDAKRRSYQIKRSRQSNDTEGNNPQPLPQSDAVLNCPACLTALCMDCQRHSIYKNQYRAMFVFNCTIDKTEALKYPTKGEKKKEFLKNKRKNKNKLEDNGKKSGEPSAGVESLEKCSEEQSKSTMECKDANCEGGEGTSSSTSSCLKESGAVRTDESHGDEKGGKSKKVSFAADSGDFYNPVTCSICNTKVAVIDKDEVYHFFNVVTSY